MIQRIVLIGPVLPFRGGIAQHTTQLHRALTGRCDLMTLSFTRQYPSWLFPGASDRDPGYRDHAEPAVQYLIDSLNPLTWRRALRQAEQHRATAAIIPWWTGYWAPFVRFMSIRLSQRGVRPVILCHNPVEHESGRWRGWLMRWALSSSTDFVVHSRYAQASLLEMFPAARVRAYPHPIYGHFPSSTKSEPPEAALNLLFFGFVRPYKGLDVLLRAVASVKEPPLRLVVAGEFWEELEATHQLITSLGILDRVELRPWFQTEAETAGLFSRTDIVVLPYRSATSSGVVPLAYHYCRPVLATRVGGLPEVIHEGVTGFLVDADDSGALASALSSLSRPRLAAMQPAIAKICQHMSWDGLANTLLSACSDTVESEQWERKPRTWGRR